MKILVLDSVAQDGVTVLEQIPGATVVVRDKLSHAELLEEIRDCDAVIVRSQTKITAEVIEASGRLRVIGRAGVGVDNIDISAATRRGIVVVNAPDGNTIAAAEHTFAMLISASRHIPQADASIRAGLWDRNRYVGVQLQGKTLAVLGMGRIGTEVARRAKVFGMRILAYDPFLTDARANELGVSRVSLEEAIEGADFITVHTPLTKETRHLLGREAFGRMKRGVRIVNCARGGIIDEQALVEAIRTGQVGGASLDVFESEPLGADHPLRNIEGVVLTPHLGASTVEAQVQVAIDVAVEISNVLQGLPFKNAVNLPSMTAEQKAYLEPFLSLAEQLGTFAAQWLEKDVNSVEISYSGQLADHDVSFVTRTVLKGLLGYRYADTVNYVNAMVMAEQVGLTVREVRQTQSRVFTNAIRLSTLGEEGAHHLVGTLYNGFGPRIVEIDGYTVDVPPQGTFVFTRHHDKPGMIGKIGTWLGDAEINIAGMQVGRKETGGEAVMFLSVDKVVPEDVIAQISRIPGIQVVRSIEL